jgi:hypothetical protein
MAVMILGSTSAAFAQGTPPPQTYPTWELSGGYQILHVPEETFPFGLNVDGAWNLSESLGLVAEIGFARKSEDFDNGDLDDDGGGEFDLTIWNFGAGPRWNLRRSPKLWPYAQVLAGFAHARASADVLGVDADSSETRFMIQPGVGIDWVAGDGWGIIGAIDYRRVFLDEEEHGESGENEFRVFLGARMILD